MVTSTGRQRPFPALAIVVVLLAACLFPGQGLIGHLFPRLSGLVTVNPSIIIFDIPVQLPVTVDLVLVPLLFLTIYFLVILFYPGRRGISLPREIAARIGAILSGIFITLFFVACGGMIAYMAQDHFPRNVRNGIESLGINADINLPFSVAHVIHWHGNFLALLFLAIGIAISIAKINRAPQTHKTAPLTKEQRITPYQRMLKEKRQNTAQATRPAAEPQQEPTAAKANPKPRLQATKPALLCSPAPLFSLEPEAVNYRPLS